MSSVDCVHGYEQEGEPRVIVEVKTRSEWPVSRYRLGWKDRLEPTLD